MSKTFEHTLIFVFILSVFVALEMSFAWRLQVECHQDAASDPLWCTSK